MISIFADKLGKHGNSLLARILILFLVCNIVSVGLFSYLLYNVYKNNRLTTIEKSLEEISAEKAQLLSLTMSHIENEVENLAEWTEEYLDNNDGASMSEEYAFDSKNTLYRKADKSVSKESFASRHSSVYYPGKREFTEEIEHMVAATEYLDPVFERIKKRNPYLSWAAVPMGNGFLRIFPYEEMDMYDDSHMQSDDPFYVMATTDNPKNETRWSVPYVDLMGTGWVMTCAHPILRKGEVIGIATLDVSMETMENEFLKDLRLSEEGFVFVVTEDGNAVFHPDVKPKSEEKGDILDIDIIKDAGFSGAYKKAIKEVIRNKEGVVTYSQGGTTHTICYTTAEDLDWIVAAEVEIKENLFTGFIHSSWFLLVLALSIIMMVLFALFLYRNYWVPIERVTSWANEISEGDYRTKEMTSEYTEIAALTNAFNNMCEEMQERELFKREAIQKDKLANIGQISASIAHEFKTPLQVIKGSVFLLKKNEDDEKQKKQLNTIEESVRDAESIVDDLLDFSRTSEDNIQPIDLKKLIEQIIIITRQEQNRTNVIVKTDFDRDPFIVNGQKEYLKHILINIFVNALTAVEDHGEISIMCTTGVDESVEIRIRDNGPGIDPVIKESLFQPFATYGKKDGVGLGLWITKTLLDRMDGEIEINTEGIDGTEVIIRLKNMELDTDS